MRECIRRFTAVSGAALVLISACAGLFGAEEVRADQEGATAAAQDFFDELTEGNLQEAGKSTSVVEAIRLGLYTIRADIYGIAAEITGADMDLAPETQEMLKGEANRLTDELLKSIVSNYEINPLVTSDGNTYYLTGTADLLAVETLTGFDYITEVDPAAVRDAFAAENPDEWAQLEAIADDNDRFEAELAAMTPYYVNEIMDFVRTLEPVTTAWTMSVKYNRDSYSIVSTDLDLITEQEPVYVEPEGPLSFWNRNWYGWWVMTDAAGSKADFNNYWFDCCATIDIDENGDGVLVFWDEDTSKANWLGKVNIHVDLESGLYGVMTSTYGTFWTEPVGPDEWRAEPGEYFAENLLGIEAQYDDGEGSFTYLIYLRPWGTLWDDMDEDDLPYYYYNWYLPLLDDGSEMPAEMILPEAEE